MRRRAAVALVLVLLSAACTGPDGEPEPEPDLPSLVEVDRAILSVVPAAGVGEDGEPVEPANVFSSDVRAITVVARVGDVDAPVELTWFQVAGEDETELFSHRVEVEPFGAAWSEGTNPGELAEGTYRVDASVGEETRSATFDVRAADARPAPLAQDLPPMELPPMELPPEEGESGAYESTPPMEAGMTTHVLFEPVDTDTPTVASRIFTRVQGYEDVRVSASATMGGTVRALSIPVTAGTETHQLEFNPCRHPGGSDLPGTVLKFEFALVGFVDQAPQVHETRLGPDVSRPDTYLITVPPAGSRVNPGDEISVIASAFERREGASWQTGVQRVQVTATPGGLVGEPAEASSRLPGSCGSKQWDLEMEPATYEVPEDASGVIEVCAIGEDYAGNAGTTCAAFYSGEVWEGTYNGQVTYPTCNPASTFNGRVTLEVAPDGAVTATVSDGTIVHTLSSCEGGGSDVTETGLSGTVTGTKTASGFSIEGGIPGAGVLPRPLLVEVEFGTGTGSLTFTNGSLRTVVRMDLTRVLENPDVG